MDNMYLQLREKAGVNDIKKEVKVHRGEVYFANFGDNTGSELNKIRPCVIVQNDVGNLYSATTIVAPISHKPNKRQPTQVELTCDMQERGWKPVDGVILAEQIRTIDKSRLLNLVGAINAFGMVAVDRALMTSIGLN